MLSFFSQLSSEQTNICWGVIGSSMKEESQARYSEKAASNIDSLEGPDDEITLDLESPKFCPPNAGIFSLVSQLSFEIDSEDGVVSEKLKK